MKSERAAIALALSAAAIRLIPLQWLHPLNWDEIEFYRASRWIAERKLPFRDFWEHHTPLAWFVFAPFTRLTDSPGVDAIVVMRWAQVPVWIAAFWLANLWMRNAGLSRFARWAAIALACSSTLLMNPAVEFRIDPLACALYLGALVLWQRETRLSMFGAGALLCLTGFTNIRLGPLIVVTVILLRVIDAKARAWKDHLRANWMLAGGAATLIVALVWLTATDLLHAAVRQVLVENYVGDKYATAIVGGFVHRMLVPFGIRVIGEPAFELAAVDIGGIVLLLAGLAGLVVALKGWRTPGNLFLMAVLQAVSLIVIGTMNFVYNYHLEIVAIMMLPLIALIVETIPRRSIIFAVLVIAWCVNAFASLFRGKELDLAYQDFVMREVHERTRADEKVWSGIPWTLRREPAYRFWFLPDMARHLVARGYEPRYPLREIVRNPPAAVIADHYALIWMTSAQREIAPFFIRHYIPVWRNVWVPCMNVRLQPGQQFEWIVPRDGTYRLFASSEMAKHRWFRDPFYVAATSAANFTLRLPPPRETRVLRTGERFTLRNNEAHPIGVFLLPGDDAVIFREPPPGASLEPATPRVTHIPQFGVRIRR